MRRVTKVLLVGPFPPAIGGVSVHLRRLLKKSLRHSSLDLAVADPGRRKFYDKSGKSKGILNAILFFLASDIVHIHISHPRRLLITKLSKLLGKKVFFTIHNPRQMNEPSTAEMIRICDKTIFVFADPAHQERLVIPAFISDENSDKSTAMLWREVPDSKVILTLGTSPASQSAGEDTYGFDLVISACEKLVSKEKILVIFVDANLTYKDRYAGDSVFQNNENIVQYQYLGAQPDFSDLIKRADVFVRATRSDGDSLSVRECLAFGTPVVASDCVKRPEGVLLFRCNDENDLAEKLTMALRYGRVIHPQQDFSMAIFDIYKKSI
jgi:glycosyltransferase involved in cell wall biosynthesis